MVIRRPKPKKAPSFGLKDGLLFAFSVVTFAITIYNTWYAWEKDKIRSIDQRPDVRMSLRVPAQGTPYGFFLENRGERPVRIFAMKPLYAKGKTSDDALVHQKRANISSIDYARVRIEGSIISEKTEIPYFIFNKTMNNDEFDAWTNYVKSLAVDYCYCTMDGNACWNKHFEFGSPDHEEQTTMCPSS
ncbi:hypothetical protein EFR84_08585 [Rhizobium chutanense]|uniref:Uncharacterized protein n=2 Tax=Rhizobium chutanense TaxID=2035448 RepID=A0A3S0R237_9HYPH|nr:hypothetical protein EFR84_08585 [Rhizobium chutanense]